MRFRLTDEMAWAREFTAWTPADLVASVRRAWDERIAESSLARPGLAGGIGAVHPALAHRARVAWIDRWLEERLGRATPKSDTRSWQAQANLWRYEAWVDLGAAEHTSPLRLHVWAPGDPGLACVWSTLAVRGPGGDWCCHPEAPRVARTMTVARAQDLWAGAEAISAHARNLEGLVDRVGEEVRVALHPRHRLVRT